MQLPLKLSKPSKPFAAAFDGLSLLCHGSSRGPTSCFCWASKLLSGTSEAPQAVSIGLRLGFETASWHVFSLKPSKASKLSQQLSVSSGLGNWHVFQHRLKPTKPSQQLSTAFRCFAMGPPEAPRAVSVGFETAIWHFRSATSCFYWASKLLSGTFSAPLNPRSSFRRPFAALPWALPRPRPHELFLLSCETAIWHFRSATNCFYWASKLLSGTFSAPLTTLPAAFDGLSLLCHGSSRGHTSCFCWASKLLSGTSEAPQAVSIGLRNCYLARFQHPLKRSKPSISSQQLSTAFRCFCHGPSRGPTSCFCWASKLLSGTSEAPQAVSIGLRLGFETASWHVFSLNPSKASKPSQQLSVSIGLQNCYLARFSAPLKTFKSLKALPAAFNGLSLLCHGTSRGPTSCFCWASKLLSDTSEAPQAVSIGLRNCYLARFQHPLKPSIPSKPSQQLSTAFRCFAMGPPEAPRAVSVGL